MGIVAGIAGVVGAAGSVYAASQAGKGGGQQYMPYNPMHSYSADQAWQEALGQMVPYNNTPGVISPYLQRSLQYQGNLPFQQYQNAGNQAASYYPGIAGADQNSAAIMQALAGNAIGRQGDVYGAGQNLWQTSLDPQNALRDRTQHLLQENVRAGQSARGLAMTPYGAGLEDKANSDFLMDWNNQQLGRQSLGLQGLTSANLGANQSNQLAGQDLSSMLQYLNATPQAILQGGYTPIGVGQQIGGALNQAASGYANGIGQGLAIPAAIQGQTIPYLYAGQGAQGNAFAQFNANRNYDAQQLAGATQGAFQGINQFAKSPMGQSTNNWLSGLFGTGGGSSSAPAQYGYSGATGLSTEY